MLMESMIPKLDLFPKVTKVGKAIARIFKHLPDSGFPSDHGDHDTPVDTLISEPGLYVPLWKKDLPPMIYADPTEHLPASITRFDKIDGNTWDDMGNYTNPPDEAA